MRLVRKYRCRSQSVFRWHWHCLFREHCGQLKPVLFKLLQDLFSFLKLCQSLFQPIFRRADICWHTCKTYCLLVHPLRSSHILTPSPAWPAPNESIPCWTCCIPLHFSSQLKTYISNLSFVTVLTCVSVHAQHSSKYHVGIVLEWRSEVLC